MTKPGSGGSHQRSATRAPVGRPIKLQFDDSMDVIEGLCRNISIGGMYIAFEDSRPAGSLVRFELQLEDDAAIRGLGEVVWMKPKGEFGGPEPGFGLKFRFLEQSDRQLIFKLVSQHIKERLSKRGTEDEPAASSANSLAASAVSVPPLEVPPVAVPPSSETPPASPPVSPPEATLAAPRFDPPEAAPVLESPEESPTPEAPESLGPTALELPFEAPASAPSAPSRPADLSPATSARRPSSVLPPLEDLQAAELESGEPGMGAQDSSKTSGTFNFDAIDLDPSVGQTPMYELGLKSESPSVAGRDVDPGSDSEVPAVVTRQDGGEEPAVYSQADDPWLNAGQDRKSPKRHLPKLLVLGVVLAALAGAFFLYQDQWTDREPVVESVGPESATARVEDETLSEGSGEAVPSAQGAAPPNSTQEPEDSEPLAELADSTPAVTPPPAAAPPPPAVAPPPPAVAPPPPAVALPPPTVAPPPPATTSSAVDGFTRLVDVASEQAAGGIKIILTADGPIPTGRYKYFRLSGGSPREVVKLLGVSRGFAKSQISIGGPGVRQVRFGFHRVSGGHELHVVLDLTGSEWAITEVNNVGSRLEVTVAQP